MSPSGFHTQVLGCSHKGDRWAVRKMGLVTVCPREKEKDVYLPLSSAHTHTCIFSNCGGEALLCLPCLEKEGERVTQRQRERKEERERQCLQCKDDILMSQRGKER